MSIAWLHKRSKCVPRDFELQTRRYIRLMRLISPIVAAVTTILVAGVYAHDEPGPQSLPNLFSVNSINDITKSGWRLTGDIRYDQGRLLVQNGAIWKEKELANTDNEWVMELTFRTLGISSDSANTATTNGLALWLTSKRETDTSNYGGPAKFDGFQFLLNSGADIRGLAIFNGDGQTPIEPGSANALGECRFNYLDSLVPFTLRISYTKATNIFKVQIDNNLCFRTDKIIIPHGQKLHLGISALLGSSEEYEIFKLNVWDHLTQDAIDDHGLIEDGKLKLQFKTIVASQNAKSPQESVLERQRQFIEQQQEQKHQDSLVQPQLKEILSHVLSLENRIDSLVQQLASGSGGLGTDGLAITLQFNEFRQEIVKYESEMLRAFKELNDRLVGEVREHQHTVDTLTKQMDLLMSHHEELANLQPPQVLGDSQLESAIVLTIFRWVLLPVIILLALILVVMFRLRRDIKHLKLL